MSTKFLLSSLAVSGVLVGTEAAYAWVSASNSQFGVTSNASDRNQPTGDSRANAILTDDDAFSASHHSATPGNKSNLAQQNRVATFSADRVARQSSQPTQQVNVSTSDVANFGSRQASMPPTAPSEMAIEIPVPLPRQQSIKPVAPVSRLPKVTGAAPVVESQVIANTPLSESEASIEIPVPPPLKQSIGTVPPVAQLPSVTKTIPAVTAIPTVQSGDTPTTAAVPLDPSQIAIYPLLHPAPITSRFGWRTHPLTGKRRFHSGVDLGAVMGAPVVATVSGTVTSAGWNGGYGKAVVIEHNGIYQTLYGHLSEISVRAGQPIERGTVLGLVGNTGNSTGPHLHFEQRVSTNGNWIAVNPIEEIKYALENLNRSDPFAQEERAPGI